MGSGKIFHCPECGYSFRALSGVGFAFRKIRADTLSKAKRGELGEEAKRFFDEHPDGEIDCAYTAMKCEKCGEYESRISVTMYFPDGEEYAEIPNKCRKCGGVLRHVSANETMICPKCKSNMTSSGRILWD